MRLTLRKKLLTKPRVGGDLPNRIVPTALPASTAGAAYSVQFSTNNGVAPFTYALSSGALPSGLSLSSAGLLSGTPTASGTFNFTVQSLDSDFPQGTATRSFTLTVAVPIILLSPTSLPAASVGIAYNEQISASGGNAPYTLTLN